MVVVAVHTSAGRRHVGVARLFHMVVAIAAVETQFSGVERVIKRDGLNRLVANSGILGSKVIGESRRDGPP